MSLIQFIPLLVDLLKKNDAPRAEKKEAVTALKEKAREIDDEQDERLARLEARVVELSKAVNVLAKRSQR